MTKNNLIALAILSTTLLGSLEGAKAALSPDNIKCCINCVSKMRPTDIFENASAKKKCAKICEISAQNCP